MARRRRRPPAHSPGLAPLRTRCVGCGGPLWVAYHSHRTVTTLEGAVRLRLQVRRCVAPGCPQYHRPYRPEEELGWALPHGEFGLDVVALVGALRFREHRTVPEIHQQLRGRRLVIAERTVTHLVQRYEELLAVHLGASAACGRCWPRQEQVVLAIDGLQPDVGHEVLWVVRDCLSGEILLARSLLSGREAELAALLREVQAALAAVPVAIAGRRLRRPALHPQRGGQRPARGAPPAVPLPLPQEAALPVYEADRHAKKLLKMEVRGVRPLERALEAREAAAGPAGDPAAAAVRGYCLAVRSALTDDGRPPLAAAGLRLRERLTAIRASVARVQAQAHGKGGRALPRELSRLDRLLARGLAATAGAVAAHRAGLRLGAPRRAHPGQRRGQGRGAVRAAYARLLGEMRRRRRRGGLPGPGRRPLPAGDGQLRPGAVPLLHGGGAAPDRQRPGAPAAPRRTRRGAPPAPPAPPQPPRGQAQDEQLPPQPTPASDRPQPDPSDALGRADPSALSYWYCP